jgi:hypothetical protein
MVAKPRFVQSSYLFCPTRSEAKSERPASVPENRSGLARHKYKKMQIHRVNPAARGAFGSRHAPRAVWLLCCTLAGLAANAAHAAGIGFNRDIRPILSDRCYACHGLDAKHRQADLRLDTLEGATADHGGNHAVVPGNAEKSEMIRRINSTDPDEQMPPPTAHKTLSVAEKDLLRRWINAGAPYQKLWSFEPPVAATPPLVLLHGQPTSAVDAPVIRNPIDAFIVDRLQHEGLHQSPEADRPTLIRRVAFALTGLPPTVAEVDAYVNDHSPDAYEKMVDRYLASKRFGEEMARHWLDLARYGDTHGLHLDNERQMWAYRDWVIDSLNRNEPFDQFTIEQLAGDLLPHATFEQQIATGFNRCNVSSGEGGAIEAEFRYRYAVDRTITMSESWMGLTAGCAVCHDHKFDPISQREFYSMYAFFNSAADPGMDGNTLLVGPVVKVETPELRAQRDALDKQLAAKKNEFDAAPAKIVYHDPAEGKAHAARKIEAVWMDDDFPPGAQVQSGPGQPTTFVDAASGHVFSGARALKRTAQGLSQDYYESGAAQLFIPSKATVFAYVYLDSKNPPSEIMLQFHKDGWNHRAVWGDYNAIGVGTPSTSERLLMGQLPKADQWVRLEIPAEKLGLAAGDAITGFAFTQFGGTVFWDKLGIVGRDDPHDPSRSFRAWWAKAARQNTPGLSPELASVAKAGPKAHVKAEAEQRLRYYYIANICVDTKPQMAKLTAEIADLKAKRDAVDAAVPRSFVFNDLPTPRDSFVMMRGAYDKPGEKVVPGVPAIFTPLKKANPKGHATRLDLARWLVSPEHPLTARVAVNRYWQQLFGTGLVKSSSDFGSQGEMPSHPELLDWLAVQFRKSGWDRKAMIRMMVCSATFRQSSRLSPELYARDPQNRLYARGPRFRLDAEQIRDNALFVSRLINLAMGGRAVNPYQPPNIWEPVGFDGSTTRHYVQDTGPALYRRSIYVFLKRTAPPPFMANFDAPSREQFCCIRDRSDTPLQALELMNDTQHVEAARALAERMMTGSDSTVAGRITFAFETVLARRPDLEETAIVEQQFAAHLARYQKDTAAAKKLISQGESKPNAKLPPAELAAYTLVANTILNLDETLTRN